MLSHQSNLSFFRPCGIRALNLHEYQSKQLMDTFGLPTQHGYTAATPEEAKSGAQKLIAEGFGTVVMKCQVFAGGRGKGTLSSGLKGGVQFTKSSKEAMDLAKKMLGFKLVTHQTTKDGLQVSKLLLTEGVDIDREFYLAIIVDRAQGGPVIVASREGGIDIEEVAEKKPDAIHTIPVDILKGLTKRNLEAVCEVLLPDIDSSIPKSAAGLSRRQKEAIYLDLNHQLKCTLKKLYKLFTTCDASQIEINPLAITNDDRVLCVDAKLNFDDNANFRQKELFAQEDLTTRCPREVGAEEMGMNYISMDGNIGCLVNGAGLAMATMDLIQFGGGKPANFLDLGGGATKEQVLRALQLITSDPSVKAIFVNIFGGITRCDVVAQGIADAAKELGMKVPLIVRLVGNSAEEAREILNSPALKNSGVRITYVQDFADAAKAAVRIAGQ